MNAGSVRRWFTYGLILAVAIGLSYIMTAKKQPPKINKFGQSIPTVAVRKVHVDTINTTIAVDGPVRAIQKIEVSTEVGGKLLTGTKSFKEGVRFSKGEVLLQLKETDIRLQVVSSRSAFQRVLTQLLADLNIDYPDTYGAFVKYVEGFDPNISVKALPEVQASKAKNFLISKGVYNQYFAIKSQEAQLAKFTVVAPFDGVVSQANLNANTVIQPGKKLGEFVSTDRFEMEIGLGLEQVGRMDIGTTVELTSPQLPGHWRGTISRIGRQLDQKSQMVKAYVELSGPGLYDGMFLQGKINLGSLEHVIELPRYLILANDELLVVEDTVLRIVAVDVVHKQDKKVVVKGLPVGTLVVDQVVSGAYDGMRVNTNQ